jgi:glucan phosphoethanolaminetransferase (alkaline phosphatase superfamily)
MCMELPGVQTWIVFYLLSFVVLLWAAFLSAKGVMLWVSLMLVLVIVGVNFYVVFTQIKLQISRKQMQHDLTKDFVRGEKLVTDDRPKH